MHYCFRKVLTPSLTPIYSVNQWCMGIVSLKSNNVICKEENLKYGKETVLYNKSCKTFAKRYTVQKQCNVVVSENRSTAVLTKLNFRSDTNFVFCPYCFFNVDRTSRHYFYVIVYPLFWNKGKAIVITLGNRCLWTPICY